MTDARRDAAPAGMLPRIYARTREISRQSRFLQATARTLKKAASRVPLLYKESVTGKSITTIVSVFSRQPVSRACLTIVAAGVAMALVRIFIFKSRVHPASWIMLCALTVCGIKSWSQEKKCCNF